MKRDLSELDIEVQFLNEVAEHLKSGLMIELVESSYCAGTVGILPERRHFVVVFSLDFTLLQTGG